MYQQNGETMKKREKMLHFFLPHISFLGSAAGAGQL